MFFSNISISLKLLSLHPNRAFKLTKANTADSLVKDVQPAYKGFLESISMLSYKVVCACPYIVPYSSHTTCFNLAFLSSYIFVQFSFGLLIFFVRMRRNWVLTIGEIMSVVRKVKKLTSRNQKPERR